MGDQQVAVGGAGPASGAFLQPGGGEVEGVLVDVDGVGAAGSGDGEPAVVAVEIVEAESADACAGQAGSDSRCFIEVGHAVREARLARQALSRPASHQPSEPRLSVWPTEVHREPLTSGGPARIGLNRQEFDRAVHAMSAVPTEPHGCH